MIHEICVTGYETYVPILFDCDCSAEEFKVIVARLIDEIVNNMGADDGYISGHYILDRLSVPLVKMGYRRIEPDSVIDLKGESLYLPNDEYYINKPDVMSDKSWEKVLKQNDVVDNRVYEKKETKNG